MHDALTELIRKLPDWMLFILLLAFIGGLWFTHPGMIWNWILQLLHLRTRNSNVPKDPPDVG